ncbi:DNA-3-methyladenine glycosylase I [Pelagirhabdus alkalitolerans]|uniref:DNA-3-methyladenine glycosylase I n=1 Tax=Pelagirhabdus alkalitolerans TaxID=1612202 RepID=A0A1G6GR26_9BACI|nr:DNA-3-methyladenine glycosylase I [Pelagirhabdus alkalitolerans]SDB84414.1 DNA-3-methyladenine glycosylase I [Pelagirhabdus alkalitolerans]
MTNRCSWVTNDSLYIDYHDHEWGVPVFDDQLLFEMLCLEGAQAGLSWWTILQKRDHYREIFDHFDPYKIAKYDEEKLNTIINDKRIVRNKLKIKSVVTNAQCYINITENGQSFSDYLWGFVDHEPIINHWQSDRDVPTSTDISKAMSKQLKKNGFKFVGPTICYAFMQAVGMVNGHTTNCFRHPDAI